ncbi:MAG: glycosyltransferase, partial [Patescibacteria group bacterium]
MPHASKKIPRVVYLFTGSRDGILSGVKKGEATDMPLYGLNHMPGAEHLSIGNSAGITKLIRSFVVVLRLLQYDFVIAQDTMVLGYIVSVYARVFRLKTRWLYLAMTSSVLMRRHATHPIRLLLFKKFWASYARIVCLSREQLEDFVQLGIPRDHLVFIPFGVDA